MSYFQIPKNIDDSQKCCETFEKIFKENTSKKYKKSEEKIYNILCYTILNLVLLGLIFKKNEIKKTDTYFILVLMVLGIGAQFFIHN